METEITIDGVPIQPMLEELPDHTFACTFAGVTIIMCESFIKILNQRHDPTTITGFNAHAPFILAKEILVLPGREGFISFCPHPSVR